MILRCDAAVRQLACSSRVAPTGPVPLGVVAMRAFAARDTNCTATRLAFQMRTVSSSVSLPKSSQLLTHEDMHLHVSAVLQHLRQRTAPMSGSTITADSQLEILESSYRLLRIACRALKLPLESECSGDSRSSDTLHRSMSVQQVGADERLALCKLVAALLQLAREASSGRVSERSRQKGSQLQRSHQQLPQAPPCGSLSHLSLAVEAASLLRRIVFPEGATAAAGPISAASVSRSGASLYRDVALILAGLLKSDPTLRAWLRLSADWDSFASSISPEAAKTAASAAAGRSAAAWGGVDPEAAWLCSLQMLRNLRNCDVPAALAAERKAAAGRTSNLADAAARAAGLPTKDVSASDAAADAESSAALVHEVGKISAALHQSMTLACSALVLAIHRGAFTAQCSVFADTYGNAQRPHDWESKTESPASLAAQALAPLNSARLRCAALVAALMPHLRADADDVCASAALWYEAASVDAAASTDAAVMEAASAGAAADATSTDAATATAATDAVSSDAGIVTSLDVPDGQQRTATGADAVADSHAAPQASEGEPTTSTVSEVMKPALAASFPVLQRRLESLLAALMALRGQDAVEGGFAAALMRAAVTCARTANHPVVAEAPHAGELRASATAVLQTCMSLAPDWQALHPRHWSRAGAAAGLDRCREETRDWLVVSATLAAADVEDAAAELGLQREADAAAPMPLTTTRESAPGFRSEAEAGDDSAADEGATELVLGAADASYAPRLRAVHLAGFLTHPRGKVFSVHRGRALRLSMAHQAAEASALVCALRHPSVVAAVSTLHSILLAASTDVLGWGTDKSDAHDHASMRKVPPSPLLPAAEAMQAARPLLKAVVELLRRAVEVDKLTAEGLLAPRNYSLASGAVAGAGASEVSAAAAGGAGAGASPLSVSWGSISASLGRAGGADSSTSASPASSSLPTALLGASARRPDAGSIIYARVRSDKLRGAPRTAEEQAAEQAMASSLAQTRRYARNAIANLQGTLAWLVANRLVKPGAAPLTRKHREAKEKANDEEEQQMRSSSGALWPLWMHSLVNLGSAHRSLLRCRADSFEDSAAAAAADDGKNKVVTGADATASSPAMRRRAAAYPFEADDEEHDERRPYRDDDGKSHHDEDDFEYEDGFSTYAKQTVQAAVNALRPSPSVGVLCRDLAAQNGAPLRELSSAVTTICAKLDAPVPSVATWSYELAAPSLLRLGGPQQPHIVEVLGRSAFLSAHQREAASLARRDAYTAQRLAAAAAAAAAEEQMRSDGGAPSKAPAAPAEPIAVLVPAGSRLPMFKGDAADVRRRLFQVLRPAAVSRVRSLRVCEASVYFLTVQTASAADADGDPAGAATATSLAHTLATASGVATPSPADDALTAQDLARLRESFAWQLRPWARTLHRLVKEYRESERRLAEQRRRDRQVAAAGGEGPEAHDHASLRRPERRGDSPSSGRPPRGRGSSFFSAAPSARGRESSSASFEPTSTAASDATGVGKLHVSHPPHRSSDAGLAVPAGKLQLEDVHSLYWGEEGSDNDGPSAALPASVHGTARGTSGGTRGTPHDLHDLVFDLSTPGGSGSGSGSHTGQRLFSDRSAPVPASGRMLGAPAAVYASIAAQARAPDSGPPGTASAARDDDSDSDFDDGDVVDVADISLPPHEEPQGEDGEEQLPRPRPEAARQTHLPSPADVSADMRRAADAAGASGLDPGLGLGLGDEFDDAGWSDDDGDGAGAAGTGDAAAGGDHPVASAMSAGGARATVAAPSLLPPTPPRPLA